MDKSLGQYAQCNKSIPERQILNYSTYMNHLKYSNAQECSGVFNRQLEKNSECFNDCKISVMQDE
jgi:hypothetical protein